MIEDIYVPAIQSRVDAREFWNLTLGEILASIDAYNRELNLTVELQKQSVYTTAALTAQFVGLSMSGKPLPSYNDCFGITSTTGNNEELMSQKMKQYESQWMAFAYEHNRRNKKNNGG